MEDQIKNISYEMKQRIGDLVAEAKEGAFDVIVHGCNCFRNMGAGIALTIKEEFPEAWVADNDGDDEPHQMGSVTYAETDSCIVVNGYTQFYPGQPRDLDTDVKRYDAIGQVLTWVNNKFEGKKVGLPLIGCGLAGLDWNIVKQIIETNMPDVDVEVVHWIGDVTRIGEARGQKLVLANHTWFIKETGEEYTDGVARQLQCSKCGEKPTELGHDPCIANLEGVRFACCGHGNIEQAYIMFDNEDSTIIRGQEAIAEFNKRGKGSDKNLFS